MPRILELFIARKIGEMKQKLSTIKL